MSFWYYYAKVSNSPITWIALLIILSMMLGNPFLLIPLIFVYHYYQNKFEDIDSQLRRAEEKISQLEEKLNKD
jgi:hypothetical protein